MLKTASCLLGGLWLVSSPAFAGLFADDDARRKIQQLEARIVQLEQRLAQSETQNKSAARSLLDLQMQLEMQATDLRKQRGQLEEFGHALQESEKRQKDFYTDLDTRLRPLENSATGAAAQATPGSGAGSASGENQSFETAYGLYRAEKYAEAAHALTKFLEQYPQSTRAANVYYLLGNAYFLSKNYRDAVNAYGVLLDKYDDHPRAPDSMLNLAECQSLLKQQDKAKATLKQLISHFPGSEAAATAKKRLAKLK